MFCVWGSWWFFSIFLAHRRRRHPQSQAVSSAWYAAPSFFPAWLSLIEPAIKIVAPLIGFADELLPWDPLFTDGVMNHAPIHALQHCVMYASILWSGLLDLACLRQDVHVPRGLEGLMLSAGFAAQAFVLVFHLTGPALDVRLHSLLVVATFGVAAAVAVALLLPHSELAAFVRCVALLTLGSFWIQVGDLIYCRPAYDTPEGVAIAPTILVFHVFAWSVALVGCLLLAPFRADAEAEPDLEGSPRPLSGKAVRARDKVDVD